MKAKLLIAAAMAGVWALPALASPWAEVGDNQRRSDVEFLAASGVVDTPATHWPLPWNALIESLGQTDMTLMPASVQEAAGRLTTDFQEQTRQGTSAMLSLDATNTPGVVYGFDGMGRGEGAAQLSLGYMAQGYSARLSVGAFSPQFGGRGNKLMMDGSYLAADLGGALVYGGYLDHWWGPGWISALSLSNNARPMPQIGIERLDTSASSWPIFRWMGPWQIEFVMGALDGARLQPDVFWNGLRWTIHPAEGLEIGLARTEQFCGQGHPCAPLRDYFSLSNDPKNTNNTNDQGLFDVKYSYRLWGVPVQSYMQLMNEDSSPFTHSGTSHQFGTTVFLPASTSPVRLTVEYTDSVPTHDIFSFGDVMHGFAYNNRDYPDGMRYRGRTLGFSLDSDSRLLSLQGSWTDQGGRFYELTLHHAEISNAANTVGNSVTAVPVTANIGEARISLPLASMKLDLAARLSDDQPRPGKGASAAVEAMIKVPF